jgi:hypothetical protein
MDEFLISNMEARLKELYDKIRFPFDDPVDYRVLKPELDMSVEILRTLHRAYTKADRGE